MSTGQPPPDTAIGWIRDYQLCLRGQYGVWWKLRAERVPMTNNSYWRRWSQIRHNESPPQDGGMLQAIKSP